MEDVKRAAELAVKREELLHEAALAAKTNPVTGFLYGVVLDRGMSVAARDAVAAELRRRAGECEASLRELGVVFPGDQVPLPKGYTSAHDAAAENATVVRGRPDPRLHEIGHPVLNRSSWDPDAGTFIVRVPCRPATASRWIDGALVQVDEALNPMGLSGGTFGTPVIDQTGAEAIVGTVDGCGIASGDSAGDEIELTVRLNRSDRLVRSAIEERRLVVAGVGYEILYEEVTDRGGGHLFADVIRWRLGEIRLHRRDAMAEVA
ncbi:hypothetical protein [Methylorubrum extorquens]|uniref:hypothetical protein n=1 Tax=Methylorubrum extorquens TaxID=408 RepID=UPI0013010033|nr:hypothetical protein [Methylorubrum extorquens]